MDKNQISDLADEALHAACAVIQDRLGQTDGGMAGIYFSGDHLIREILTDYIMQEIQGLTFDHYSKLEKT